MSGEESREEEIEFRVSDLKNGQIFVFLDKPGIPLMKYGREIVPVHRKLGDIWRIIGRGFPVSQSQKRPIRILT